MVAEQAERHRQREGFGNDIAQGAALPQWVAPLKVLCQAGISMLSMDLPCCFMIACGRPIRRYAQMPIGPAQSMVIGQTRFMIFIGCG